MAYLRYNSGRINYSSNPSESRLVLSDVINSSCGPEIPKIIKTADEFDIYFGKDFSSRPYYLTLLSEGVHFIAGRPISTKNRSDLDEFYDYETWPVIEVPEIPEKDFSGFIFKVYTTEDRSDWKYYIESSTPGKLREIPMTDIKYIGNLSIDDWQGTNPLVITIKDEHYLYLEGVYSLMSLIELSEIPEDLRKVQCKLYDKPETYVWSKVLGDYIDTSYLEQNDGSIESSVSWKNRDSLRICSPDSGISYCHPRYDVDYSDPLSYYTHNVSGMESNISDRDLQAIEDRTKTLALRLDFSGVEKFYPDPKENGKEIEEDSYYMVIPYLDQERYYTNIIIWFKRTWIEGSIDTIPLGSDNIANCIKKTIELTKEMTKEEIISRVIQILNEISELNTTEEVYQKINYITDYYETSGIIYLTGPLRNRFFFNIPGLIFQEDYQTTQDLLSQITMDEGRIEFYSRTLGPASDNIKITIEKIKYSPYKYRVYVSRYEYQEVHEGNIYTLPDYNGEVSYLESIINKNSKLIRCKIKKTYSLGLTEKRVPSTIEENLKYTRIYLNGILQVWDPDSKTFKEETPEKDEISETTENLQDSESEFKIGNQIYKWNKKKQWYDISSPEEGKEYNESLGSLSENHYYDVFRIGRNIYKWDIENLTFIADNNFQLEDCFSSLLTSRGGSYYIFNKNSYQEVIVEGLSFVKSYQYVNSLTPKSLPKGDPSEETYKVGRFFYVWSKDLEKFIKIPKESILTDVYELDALPENSEFIIFTYGGHKWIWNSASGTYRLYKSGDLQEGTWELTRAVVEEYTPEMFFRTLDIYRGYDYLEDFLVIPDIYLYHSIDSLTNEDEDHFPEYERFLDYAKERNCQVLIENPVLEVPFKEIITIETEGDAIPEEFTPSEGNLYILEDKYDGSVRYITSEGDISEKFELLYRTFYKSNYTYNYTKDWENRLVYFYSGILRNQVQLPGYYVFLECLLRNIPGLQMKDLLYYPPVEAYSNDYETYEKYKTNFLTCNNYTYYYRQYFNHSGDGRYETSILKRFIVSRLSRQFQNRRWNILSKSLEYEIREEVENICGLLVSMFSTIVESISLDSFNLSGKNLNFSVSTRVHELIDKNVNLSLTFNYTIS